MHNVLNEPFVPARPIIPRSRPRAKLKGADAAKEVVDAARRGEDHFFDEVNSMSFCLVKYRPILRYCRRVGKHVVSPARPQEAALSDLSESALIMELRLCLRRGQEATDVLGPHASRLSKLVEDFVIIERENTRLQYEVKFLQDAASEDKAATKTLQEELAIANRELEVLKAENESLGALKAENKSLHAILKDRREVFWHRGEGISASMARVGAYAPPFVATSPADPEVAFLD